MTKTGFPSLRMIVGAIEERGRLPPSHPVSYGHATADDLKEKSVS